VVLTEQPVPDLPPGGRVEVRMELRPLRRGPLRFERVAVARTDPFGLVRSFVRVPAAHTLLILPRRYPVPVLSLPGSLKFQHGGVAQASSVGQSDEFYSLRDYRRGDPLRHIHWRSWARTGRPVVKEHVDEFYTRHALVLDTFAPAEAWDVFEEAVSVAASFAWAVRTQESLLDLLFVGTQSYCFSAGRGLAHTQQMLEILASVQPTLDRSFQVLADSVRDHARVVSGVICVLVAWDEARQTLVRNLRESGLPIRVLVVVGATESMDLDPGPLRADPVSFRVVRVGAAEEALRTWE
jgi:uncharacterized protein (DUF58 family)